jgi:ubiquinol-cytochrome c reductase cytochrome b subunit
LGGVIAIFSALLIIFLFPIIFSQFSLSFAFYPISQLWFWTILNTVLILTWIGGCPVEHPYDLIGSFFSAFYFITVIILPISTKLWDKFIQ